ncbi:unnamed protein product, partial [Closterium sp. NIES-64]
MQISYHFFFLSVTDNADKLQTSAVSIMGSMRTSPAGLLLLALALIAVPSLSLPALSVPSLSLPALSVPSLSLPALSLPSLSLPALSLPSLSLLSLSLPSLSLPSLSLPSLSLPSLSLPSLSLPALLLPSLSLPSLSLLSLSLLSLSLPSLIAFSLIACSLIAFSLIACSLSAFSLSAFSLIACSLSAFSLIACSIIAFSLIACSLIAFSLIAFSLIAFSLIAFSLIAFSLIAFSLIAFSLIAFSLIACSLIACSLIACSLIAFSLIALSLPALSLPSLSLLSLSLLSLSLPSLIAFSHCCEIFDLRFSKKRCVSVPKKAARGRSLQVWWKGRGGSSYGGSSYGYASNVDSGSTGGGKAGGVSCSQVKLFGKGGCQGKEVDCLVNSNSTAVMSPSTKKKLPQGASVASVLCAVPEQPKEEPQPKEDTPQQPQPKEDPACAALGCEPVGGKCEVDGNGERYCKWDSPCGSCPTGATCKTVPATSNSGVPVQLPYCACPDGYGMTETSCVEGGKSTVASTSITLVAEWKAKDNTSRPYTLRWNLNGCTQYPAAVAGNYSSEYLLANINSTADCRVAYQYYTDNCEGPPNHVIYLNDDPYYPSVMV